MAAAAGVEPATCSLGESRSIQLSYATALTDAVSAKANIAKQKLLLPHSPALTKLCESTQQLRA